LPTTLAEALSSAKVFPVFRIQEAVTELPSAEIPKKGSPELSVDEERTVVAPQFAWLPVMVAERDRINSGGTARPVELIVARAQAAVALVPSSETATVGFLEWNPGAERSVVLPQETVVPLTVAVLVLIMVAAAEPTFPQTTVTTPPDEEIPSSGSSMQLP
jgi:hypothetical protein